MFEQLPLGPSLELGQTTGIDTDGIWHECQAKGERETERDRERETTSKGGPVKHKPSLSTGLLNSREALQLRQMGHKVDT